MNDLWTHFGANNLDWSFGTLENMREALKQDNPYPIRKVAASLHYLAHGITPPPNGNFGDYEEEAKNNWSVFLANERM